MCLSGSEKSCSVCRLQAGELQLPAGPEPGTGSDEGLCNGPLALSWCRCLLQPGAAGATHHLADGATLAAGCPGCSPCPSGDSAPAPQVWAGWAGSVTSTSFPPARPTAGCPFPGLCRLPAAPRSCSAAVAFFAQFTASATFPKIQFFPLPLEHCILFNPSPVTPAPALFQLDSKNNLFIHTAHAIIS